MAEGPGSVPGRELTNPAKPKGKMGTDYGGSLSETAVRSGAVSSGVRLEAAVVGRAEVSPEGKR